MPDTKDWTIEIQKLKAYKPNGWNQDYFSETFDSRYSVYIYNIDEWRMMSYGGLFAIYDAKHASLPLINSNKIWIWFDNEKTYDYAPLSDCLIFKKPANGIQSSKPNFPFFLIKPKEKQFSFIEWDLTSIYYGFKEIEKNKIAVKEIHSIDLESLKEGKRTTEIIDISHLNWHDFKDFDKALEIYWNE